MALSLAQKFINLGLAAPLAVEYATQINTGTYNWRRLMWLGMVPQLARYVAESLAAGTFDPRVAIEKTMSEAVANLTAGQGVSRLALNSTFAAIGSSSTQASGLGSWREWMMAHLRGKLYHLSNGNQGVGGNRTADVLARVADITNLHPRVGGYQAGANDLPEDTISAATMQSNIQNAVNAMLADNEFVVVFQMWPRSGALALTPDQEAKRIAVNDWMLSTLQSTRVRIALVPADFNSVVDTTDGQHLANTGAYKVGKSGADTVAPYLASGEIFLAANDATNLVASHLLPGTSGTKSISGSGITPTGEVASGWIVQNFMDVSVACSKVATTINGIACEKQRLTITGTPTVSSLVQFRRSVTANGLAGEMFDIWGGLDIAGTGLNAIGLNGGVFGSLLNAATEGENILPNISGVLRNIPATLAADAASMSIAFNVRGKAGVPINAVVDYYLPQARKIVA